MPGLWVQGLAKVGTWGCWGLGVAVGRVERRFGFNVFAGLWGF